MHSKPQKDTHFTRHPPTPHVNAIHAARKPKRIYMLINHMLYYVYIYSTTSERALCVEPYDVDGIEFSNNDDEQINGKHTLFGGEI